MMLGLFAIMPFSVIYAIDLNIESPHVMAETMPDSTEVFIASRIGTGWIAELDAVLLSMYAKLPAGLDAELLTIDDAFREGFDEEGLDWDLFLSMLGDYAAIGFEPINSFNDDEEPLATIVVEITDQSAVDIVVDLLTSGSGDAGDRTTEGDVIRYDNVGKDDATIYVTATHLIMTTNPNYSLNPTSPLSSSSEFTNALNLLNEDQYNVLAYVSESTVEAGLSDDDAQGLQFLGVSPQDASAMVAGFTFQNSTTFTTDIAMSASAPAPSSTVNINYLNAMPASTDAFVVATDLTNVYNNVIAMLEDNSNDNPGSTIPLLFRMTGLDLEDDVLSWTTGGYGMFAGADVMDIITEVATTDTVSDLDIEAGIVIEATDIDLARNTAAELGNFLEIVSRDNNEVTITQTELNGLPATLIELDVPAERGNPSITLEFVLTTTDDFFFLGTRSAFDSIMSGNTLADNPDFNNTIPQLLENSTSVWYANSDGMLIPTVAGLDSNDSDMRQFRRLFASLFNQIGDDTQQILDVLASFDDIFTSMTFSTAVDNAGVIRLRGTLTVNP